MHTFGGATISYPVMRDVKIFWGSFKRPRLFSSFCIKFAAACKSKSDVDCWTLSRYLALKMNHHDGMNSINSFLLDHSRWKHTYGTLVNNSTTLLSNSTTLLSNSATLLSNSTTMLSNSTTLLSNSTTLLSNSNIL